MPLNFWVCEHGYIADFGGPEDIHLEEQFTDMLHSGSGEVECDPEIYSIPLDDIAEKFAGREEYQVERSE